MGAYTRVGIVRSTCGIAPSVFPSYTMNIFVQQGEGFMKLYLRYTPPTTGLTGANYWIRDAATQFACWRVMNRLASENAPHAYYARDLTTDRGAKFLGHAVMGSVYYQEGIKICDSFGRGVIIDRVEPANK